MLGQKNNMRFFIALEIPENNRKELEDVQQKLKQTIPEVRLTDPEKVHLTLAFVGEQPESLKNSLIKIIQDAVLGITQFQVTPAYMDGFPSLHYPQVFWMGVKGDIDKLFIIREKIKDGLVKLKLTIDERRFIPHIAIAKTKKDFKLNPNQEESLQKIMTDKFSPIQISSIKLFESIPEHGFHIHNTLAEISLK